MWDQLDDIYDDEISPVRNNFLRVQHHCLRRLQEETDVDEKVKFLVTALSWFKVSPRRESEINEKQVVFNSLGVELANAMNEQGENNKQSFSDIYYC